VAAATAMARSRPMVSSRGPLTVTTQLDSSSTSSSASSVVVPTGISVGTGISAWPAMAASSRGERVVTHR
jgi:hypothetical protein